MDDKLKKICKQIEALPDSVDIRYMEYASAVHRHTLLTTNDLKTLAAEVERLTGKLAEFAEAERAAYKLELAEKVRGMKLIGEYPHWALKQGYNNGLDDVLDLLAPAVDGEEGK